MRQLSLHVVGAGHPNRRGGDRRFEILLCVPGEPVHLVLEPKNPADPQAVAVFSGRGVQIGYLTAERALDRRPIDERARPTPLMRVVP